LVTYNVGLCRMVNGNLDAPYEGASIEAANIPDALLKAKKWAASVEVPDNSWLQILLDSRGGSDAVKWPAFSNESPAKEGLL